MITTINEFLNEKNIKWSKDIENQFNDWMKDGNTNKNVDGSYSTQDAQWKNKLKDLDELKKYFIKEFID